MRVYKVMYKRNQTIYIHIEKHYSNWDATDSQADNGSQYLSACKED